MRKLLRILCAFILTGLIPGSAPTAGAAPWPAERANQWYSRQPWPIGCNFSPSTAINQLEMWQAASFDPGAIDRELGWAEGIGFNSARVFLHNLLWTQDKDGLLKRMDQFLQIADSHHVRVMFVLLDGVWDPYPRLGKQRDPKPGLHNSGWVQSPGVEILRNPARHEELKSYIQGVVGRFKDDRRILAWDIFNEPDNMNRPAYASLEPVNKAELALILLRRAFIWAREMAPIQPLTAAPWIGPWAPGDKLGPMDKFMLEESDIITFHDYGNLEEISQCVRNLQRFHRPIICSEYMARPRGCTFNPVAGWLKEQNVGAFNWGFVSGKTQTIYPWDSWQKPYTAEPAIWFHDIFRADGAPFDPAEITYLKSLTRK